MPWAFGCQYTSNYSPKRTLGDRAPLSPSLSAQEKTMPNSLKWNALMVTGLAVFSWCVFMFAKHDSALGPIIPFSDDPYDAVGSFAVIGSALLAVLCLFRAFRPRRTEASVAAKLYLLRAEVAIVLAAYAMVASDVIAMVRHPSAWLGAPAAKELIALIASLAVLATGTLLLIQRSSQWPRAAGRPLWTKAIVVAAACILILFFYPERLISTFLTHLLTIVFSDVMLFAPIGFLLPAMVPWELSEASGGAPEQRRVAWVRWAIVLLVGLGLGFVILIGEMKEGGPPAGRLLLVSAVYLGLTITGLFVAYAFLSKPIGLGLQNAR